VGRFQSVGNALATLGAELFGVYRQQSRSDQLAIAIVATMVCSCSGIYVLGSAIERVDRLAVPLERVDRLAVPIETSAAVSPTATKRALRVYPGMPTSRPREYPTTHRPPRDQTVAAEGIRLRATRDAEREAKRATARAQYDASSTESAKWATQSPTQDIAVEPSGPWVPLYRLEMSGDEAVFFPSGSAPRSACSTRGGDPKYPGWLRISCSGYGGGWIQKYEWE
jgi:hypothetical protein